MYLWRCCYHQQKLSAFKVMRLRNISLGWTQKSKSGLIFPTMQNLMENKMGGLTEPNKATGQRK